ncbi:MAG TPA: VOC family protein [Steroidobacteraceae bacterium]|jgi:predicted enzyme related to lactoylglutathione lyase|nr:VOC family protein [Steroidobacteraceae bacterium]
MIATTKVTMKAPGRHRKGTALGLCAALLVALSAQAGVTLNAARVGAADLPALEKFYETAFGMQEVQKIGNNEVMLNFGDSVAAAKANPAAQIVIMHRESDDQKDSMAHLIFNVTDMKATAAAIVAAGGKMEREPFVFGNTGITIGLALDPAGNHIEMLQQPKH